MFLSDFTSPQRRLTARPLSSQACRSGGRSALLHPPDWEAHRARLALRPAETTTLGFGGEATTAAAPAPNITFAALERALRAAADAHVVFLPSRLRVIDVPAGVERRYDDFCALDAELGEGVEGSS